MFEGSWPNLQMGGFIDTSSMGELEESGNLGIVDNPSPISNLGSMAC